TDDNGVEKLLPDLVETASLQPHSYLIAQSMIKSLSNEKGGYSLRKIFKGLEQGVRAAPNRAEFVVLLRNLLNNPPPTVGNVINRSPPTPGDVVALHKVYSGPDKPSPIYLRDPELLHYLMTTIFVPNTKAAQLKEDLRAKYLYLLAFAASVKENDDKTLDTSKLNETYNILKKLEAAISKKGSFGTELNSVISEVVDYIHVPAASMALIFWCRYLLLETSYYEKYFKMYESSLPLLLLEEIAFQHPLQHQHLFSLFADNLLFQNRSLSPETLIAIRKLILDRMLYLVQLGYVIPVLNFVEKHSKRLLDGNHLSYFVRKLLEMTEGPYSREYYEILLKLIENAQAVLQSGTETKSLTKKFLVDAPNLIEGSQSDRRLKNLQVYFS
ncbi:8616_t:CDS:10, partial [Ambispora leptoticha]